MARCPTRSYNRDMNMRTLLLAVSSIFITVLSVGVHALVLGEEQIRSSLDEPLLLDIRLLDWEDVNLERVEVGLASREDFEAFDLPYPSYLQDLELTLEDSTDEGAPVIRVSGSRAMVEPYLNILVSARWPGGAVLKEYVVLLDLPGTPPRTDVSDNGGANSGVSDEANSQESSQESSQTTAEQTAASASESAADSPLPGPGGESDEPDRRHYVVQPGDTLWQIARRFHPEGEARSVYQTVISLHELNAGAFVNTNITLMKANQRLRIPTLAEIREVDAELAQQIYESRLTQGQARVTALERGEAMPEFTEFAVLGSEVARDTASVESDQAVEEASVPGREQPSPDDSGLRMASGEQAFNPVPVEEDALAARVPAGGDLSPAEAQLQEEISLLESLLLERENDIAALEAQVSTLSGQLEDAEDAVSRLTSALRQTRDEAGAAQLQQEQASGNRTTVMVGGLSGLLALLLLLAGAALFRMRQHLAEQREELDALTVAVTPGPAAGARYGRFIETEPDFRDDADASDSARLHGSPEPGEVMSVDDLGYDETPKTVFEDPLKDVEEPVVYLGEAEESYGEDDEERLSYSVDMSNFDEADLQSDFQGDDAPEMVEYPISEFPSVDLQADDRGVEGNAAGNDDDIVDEIESIDFNLDALLDDLDAEGPAQASFREAGKEEWEGDEEADDDGKAGADDASRSGRWN